MIDNILNFIGWFFFIFIVIGNGLVVFFIIKICNLYLLVNWFVVFLVVVDFIVGVVFFLLGYYCVNIMYCNRIVMIFWMVLYWFVMYVLVINFCVLIWNCYFVIVYLFKYNILMIVKWFCMIILVVWLIFLVVLLVFVLGMFVISFIIVYKIMWLICVLVFYIILCMFFFYVVVCILFVV